MTVLIDSDQLIRDVKETMENTLRGTETTSPGVKEGYRLATEHAARWIKFFCAKAYEEFLDDIHQIDHP